MTLRHYDCYTMNGARLEWEPIGRCFINPDAVASIGPIVTHGKLSVRAVTTIGGSVFYISAPALYWDFPELQVA